MDSSHGLFPLVDRHNHQRSPPRICRAIDDAAHSWHWKSVAYPAYGKILAQHFPEHYRGTANAVISAAQASGPAFATFAGGIVINRFGWRPFFVFLGLASLLWLLPWFRWRPREAAGAVSQPKFDEPFAGVLAVLKQRSAWG